MSRAGCVHLTVEVLQREANKLMASNMASGAWTPSDVCGLQTSATRSTENHTSTSYDDMWVESVLLLPT